MEINISNYYQYVDKIKNLVENKEYDEAEKILLRIIEINEEKSMTCGEGVAPYYYEELALIYKKCKKPDSQIEILHRYLIQIKARGSRPKKIMEQYLKGKKVESPLMEMEKIYGEYLDRISNTKLEKVERKCNFCKHNIVLIRPNGVALFGSCCPICLESNLF